MEDHGAGISYPPMSMNFNPSRTKLRRPKKNAFRLPSKAICGIKFSIGNAGAKLFVYPSLYEGFGIPPLEAMACGIPVISSNRASLPEVVGQAGVMVDPEDIPAIAQALESVLTDSQKCRTMSRKGLQQASKFTWQACAEKTFGVYQKTLSQ